MSGVPAASRACVDAGSPGPSSATVISIAAIDGTDTDTHVSTRRRMSRRVVEQVVQQLVEQRVVAEHERELVGNVERDRIVTRLLEPMRAACEPLVDIDRLHVGTQRPGLDATHAEQVPDEPIESIGFVDHEIEQLVARLFVVLRSTSQIGRDRAYRRERCAEVVRRGSQERAALVVDVLQRLDLRRHERAHHERDDDEDDERDDILAEVDLRSTERREHERERERRGGRDDEPGDAPAEHRGPDDRDDEQQRREPHA